jgi:hypothetical protein
VCLLQTFSNWWLHNDEGHENESLQSLPFDTHFEILASPIVLNAPHIERQRDNGSAELGSTLATIPKRVVAKGPGELPSFWYHSPEA